jgi:ATP-dependent DNA helicase RecQ
LSRFEALGIDRLKPVFDALDGQIDYEELKILRLYFVSKKGTADNFPPRAPLHRPFTKEIICLANSRKYSGRCIAGKEIMGRRIGEWVRPVSHHETGELPTQELRCEDGNAPGLLDVIRIPLARHDPDSYQTENYLVGEGPWVRKGPYPFPDLRRLCDPVDSLWANGYHSHKGLNDRMPLETVREKIRSSLLFIRPDQASITVEEGPNLLKRIRAGFYFAGEEYRLPVTDPIVENRYFQKETGQYPLEKGDFHFTVSIGEPYESYCYKLVAGIVEL